MRDDTVFGLLLDVDVLLGLAACAAARRARRIRVLRQLEAAFDVLDLDDVGGTAAAARTRRCSRRSDLRARAGAHRVVAVGHAHIDSAWLWPIRETKRKCARTFASAVRLMDDYPDYRFACSQAAQYDWIERSYPTLFERIRDKVAGGQWHPGRRHVGRGRHEPAERREHRAPDRARPALLRVAVRRAQFAWSGSPTCSATRRRCRRSSRPGGCSRFVTQKLRWNKQNRVPALDVLVGGLDGTRVLTHFPPVDTYNAEITPSRGARTPRRNFNEHGWSDWSLMPFGHGNGGGGPTREMLERARRMADLDGVSPISVGTAERVLRSRRGRDSRPARRCRCGRASCTSRCTAAR